MDVRKLRGDDIVAEELAGYTEVYLAISSFADGVYHCRKTGGWIGIEHKKNIVELFWTSHEDSHRRHESSNRAVKADFSESFVRNFYEVIIDVWPVKKEEERKHYAEFLMQKIKDATEAVPITANMSLLKRVIFSLKTARQKVRWN